MKATLVVAGTLIWCCQYGVFLSKTTSYANDEVDLATQHQLLRDRTATTFSRVAFISPVHDSVVGRGVWMAPLLLQELHPTDGAKTQFPRFGAVVDSAISQHAIDDSHLTVYTTARRIRISGRLYRQDTYVWFYPSADPKTRWRYRGVRQTLGRNGFPAVREAISSESSERVFFVSDSLEKAAARQFGAAVAGRRYSVEPALSNDPHVLVARVLADGAQPMGPFVYLDASLVMPTLKCRCEPSQVGDFTLNQHYRLVPLESFKELLSKDLSSVDVPLPADAVQLEGVLRLPSSM